MVRETSAVKDFSLSQWIALLQELLDFVAVLKYVVFAALVQIDQYRSLIDLYADLGDVLEAPQHQLKEMDSGGAVVKITDLLDAQTAAALCITKTLLSKYTAAVADADVVDGFMGFLITKVTSFKCCDASCFIALVAVHYC